MQVCAHPAERRASLASVSQCGRLGFAQRAAPAGGASDETPHGTHLLTQLLALVHLLTQSTYLGALAYSVNLPRCTYLLS